MAGFFGFFDYTKPGKGIYKNVPEKPRFVYFWELFFRKFWRLIQTNLLFIAFCLPIVTIGPAISGMTKVLRDSANEQPVFLISDFWDAVKDNIKQSFAYSVIVLVFTLLMSFTIPFYFEMVADYALFYIPLTICLFLVVMFVFMSFYVMLMIVTVKLSLIQILKNAAILSIAALKTNLITSFFAAIILFASWYFYLFGALLFILITPAFLGFMICYNCYPVIKKYVIDPANPKSDEDSETQSLFSDKQDSDEK